MPTRILLITVCILPVLISLIGGHLDWEPRLTFTLAEVVNAGPIAILTVGRR